MSYTTHITIPFGDADPAGLVYYPNILHYCHLAMEEFFKEHCGVAYSSLINDKHLGFATVRIESDFLVPMIYGDRVAVEISILKIGTTSVTFDYSLRRIYDNVVYAKVRQVHVALDLITKLAKPIPHSLRQKFETA